MHLESTDLLQRQQQDKKKTERLFNNQYWDHLDQEPKLKCRCKTQTYGNLRKSEIKIFAVVS